MIHNLMRPPRLPTPFSIIALSSGNFTNSEMNIKHDYGKNSGVEWHRRDMRGRRGAMGNSYISFNFNEKLMRLYGYYIKLNLQLSFFESG